LEDALACLCLAMLNLIRNDSVLMLIPVAAVLWMRYRAPARRGCSPAYILLVLVAFFAAMTPMNLISYLVMHTSSPGATYRSLYVTDVSELTNYGSPLTLHTMLAKGVRQLIVLRAAALPMIAYRIVFLLVGCGAIFLPALWAARSDRERLALPEMTGGLAFAFALLGVYGLVLPGIGTFSALRSFTGLLPLTAVLIAVAIGWVSNNERISRRIAATVFLFYLVSGVLDDRRDLSDMNGIGDRDRRAGAFIQSRTKALPQGVVVMTADPAQFSETTGFSAIPVPNNGVGAIKQAVLDLHPSYILLDATQVEAIEAGMCAKFRSSEIEPIPGTGTDLISPHALEDAPIGPRSPAQCAATE